MVLLPCVSAVSLDPESSASSQQMVEREECCLGLGVICITSMHPQQAGTGPQPHQSQSTPSPTTRWAWRYSPQWEATSQVLFLIIEKGLVVLAYNV